MADKSWPVKPVTRPAWTDGNPSIRREPPPEFKKAGWLEEQQPPFEWMNWLFYNLGSEWLSYFEGAVDRLSFVGKSIRIVSAAASLVDGAKPSFVEDLPTCISTLADGDNVFIRDWPTQVESTLAISASNVSITMAPSVSLTPKNPALPYCFSIGKVEGVRLSGGRITGFSKAPIQVTKDARFCFITGIRYSVPGSPSADVCEIATPNTHYDDGNINELKLG